MRVLILLHDAGRAAGLAELVTLSGHAASVALEPNAGLALAERFRPDVVVINGRQTGVAHRFASLNLDSLPLFVTEPEEAGDLIDCLSGFVGVPLGE
jgi:hypothetical protein